MSFKRILVALDRHSSLAENVLNQAADLAQAQSAQVLMMHCLDAARLSALDPLPMYAPSGIPISPIHPVVGMEMQPVAAAQPQDSKQVSKQQQEFEAIDQWLSQRQTLLCDRGIQAEVERCFGQPSHEICDLAKRWNAEPNCHRASRPQRFNRSADGQREQSCYASCALCGFVRSVTVREKC